MGWTNDFASNTIKLIVIAEVPLRGFRLVLGGAQ